MEKRWTAVAAIAALLASAGPASAEGSMRAGKALLAERCGGCHAIAAVGDSPNREAPPFRVVLRQYPASDLEESLAEGIVTGHPDMPEVALEPPAIADVIAYLDALSVVAGDGSQ